MRGLANRSHGEHSKSAGISQAVLPTRAASISLLQKQGKENCQRGAKTSLMEGDRQVSHFYTNCFKAWFFNHF